MNKFLFVWHKEKNSKTVSFVQFLRSVYGSTNPYAHIMSMLLNKQAVLNVGKKPDVKRIPINLTLNEVS